MIKIFVALYMGGMMIWLSAADFGTTGWDGAYFLWDTFCKGSVLCWWCLLRYGPYEVKKCVYPVLLFSIIRLLWEILSLCTGIHINDEMPVMVLFLIAISVFSYLAFRPDGYLPKALDKRLKDVNL